MVKNMFLLLIASLMTIVMSPTVLTATDDVTVTRVSDARAVETVPLPEPVVAKAPVAGYAPVYQAPANNMLIGGRMLEVIPVGSTLVDAGNHVNKYGSLLYGHNSYNVFAPVLNMDIGSTFTVTYNGVTTTYRVAYTKTFEKNGELLQLNGSGDFMDAVSRAVYMGTSYGISVMTCAGQSLGNGDATHRYVLFANAV